MAEGDQYMISAAIDFGTTFSGYAFSFIDEYRRDPLKVSAHSWPADNLLSMKTSTCVLFDPKGVFSKFGFEAEEEYSNLARNNEHKNWYYFRRFKMELYEAKTLNRDMEIMDECGKTMPAIKVFAAGIKYLKDNLLDTCMRQRVAIFHSDIRWVLTVPAIWSDSAKQFMRKAAEEAGLEADQLKIALEPEAASLYCRYKPVTRNAMGDFAVFKAGSKYLILDAGGGTTDITVHEVQSDGSLREIHKANGGDWGGTKIENAFGDFLSEIVGKSAYDQFCRENKYDVLDLFLDIEVKKRKLKPDGEGSVNLKIPMTLNQCCISNTGKDIFQQVETNPDISGVRVMADKLILDATRASKMFNETTEHIVDHLKALLRHPDVMHVEHIFMVGGFSESLILQEVIKSNFPNIRVIVPAQAGLAVLIGAVIYGHEPMSIKSRICKVTYGIKTNRTFDPRIHPVSKRWETSEGKIKCKDLFDIHVRDGDEVMVGEPQACRDYSVIDANQTVIRFEVWISHQRDPKYVTDNRCEKLGTLKIDMPDTSRGLDRSVFVQMIFGGTELKVEATDKSNGESVSASFDFLNI